jgi:hypothetical protein
LAGRRRVVAPADVRFHRLPLHPHF